MKTTFLLHGGYTPGNDEKDRGSFYEAIQRYAPSPVKILIVPFAKDEDRREMAGSNVREQFERVSAERMLEMEIAEENSFENQVLRADVVYFCGGRSLKLLEALRIYPTLNELLRGKIVAGESAGANVLCQFFYSPHADAVDEGLGMLPLKMIPHFREEFAGKLEGVGRGLELLELPENEFRVFEVE